MRTTPFVLAALLFLFTSAPAATAETQPFELTLMSYNIRLDIASDGPNQWENRRDQLAAQIAFVDPDVFGIQEGLPQQVEFLETRLPDYDRVGVGRDDGVSAGEHSAVFYKSDTNELLDSSTFWLSETPDRPSFGWGASYRRICTYARLRDRASGKVYWIFNTHFDHQVEEARQNGAKLILQRIQQLVPPGEPYFLMGDLNSTPEQAPTLLIASELLDARLSSVGPVFGPEGTFNSFDPTQPAERRIDYIFTSPSGASVTAFATLSDLVDQRYLSDHFPVVAKVRLHENRAPATLRVSENQRYLVTDKGEPFFWLGDTAWELFHRLSLEEAVRYLDVRAEQGFTLVQAVALAELEGLTGPNANGDLPLIGQDPSQPNDAYFQHVDAIVQAANERGIVIGMLPTWGDKFNLRWGVGPEVFTPENAEAYGRFLGERYKDASIVWILGGDRIPEEDEDFAIIEAMAKGIQAGDGGRHLMTYHPMGRKTSSAFFHEKEWLDFNMYQSGHSDRHYPNFNDTLKDFNRSPIKPVLDGEPCYEDHPVAWKHEELGWFDESDTRKAGYWSMLAGALGHTYGHHAVWQMWQPGRPPISSVRTPWHEAIHYPGAWQAGYMRTAFESIDWWRLEPKQELLLESPEDVARSIRVAASDNAIVAYAPYGDTFALDSNALKTGCTARWFDPSTGTQIPFDLSESQNGNLAFDPPADPEVGNDWLLILSDR